MVSTENKSVLDDFLVLNYRDKDFLISRNQFSGSTSITDRKHLKSKNSYFRSYIPYNGEKMLLCDFNLYLKDKFDSEEAGMSQVSLILHLKDTPPRHRKILMKFLSQNPSFSQTALGIIVTSQAEIHQLPLYELNLNPPGLDQRLQFFGLLGVRFADETRVQFFIDLQKNLINILTGRNHENSSR